MCSTFFCGHGYSEAFTANMTEMLRLFRQDDPYITLTGGTDCICASCPHSLSHVCDAAEKVQRYDSAVLMFCGLSVGSVLRWSEFTDRISRHILEPGLLQDICGDCQWYSICVLYFYIDFLYSEQGRTIFLEISTTTYYNNMQEWLDELSQYSTREHEIAVQDESWLIDYYPDNEERTLYGIMPDSGADYALMIWRDDGEKDTQNDLMTVREALGI